MRSSGLAISSAINLLCQHSKDATYNAALILTPSEGFEPPCPKTPVFKTGAIPILLQDGKKCELGWRDSDPRLQESKSCALPLGDSPLVLIMSFDKIDSVHYQAGGERIERSFRILEIRVIPLHYSPIFSKHHAGIEPALQVWKTRVIAVRPMVHLSRQTLLKEKLPTLGFVCAFNAFL